MGNAVPGLFLVEYLQTRRRFAVARPSFLSTSMQICVLNSGSNGNCLFLSSGGTAVLVDAGITYLQIRKRLAAIGPAPSELSAVLVTHEHSDHCVGLPMLCEKNPALTLYANYETFRGVEDALRRQIKPEHPLRWANFETGDTFEVGTFSVETFGIQHDTADPVAYVVSDGKCRIGVATDLGCVTEVVKRHLSGCDALVLETNHDVDMLMESDRSWALKQRIRGRNGHLSNEQAAELLAYAYSDRLRVVFPAHVSGDCNTPDLAVRAVDIALRALKCRERVTICPTHRDGASDLVEL